MTFHFMMSHLVTELSVSIVANKWGLPIFLNLKKIDCHFYLFSLSFTIRKTTGWNFFVLTFNIIPDVHLPVFTFINSYEFLNFIEVVSIQQLCMNSYFDSSYHFQPFLIINALHRKNKHKDSIVLITFSSQFLKQFLLYCKEPLE